MSHTATNPNFVDNGAGQCWHCGKPETEHPPAGWDRAEPGPEREGYEHWIDPDPRFRDDRGPDGSLPPR